MVYFANRDGIAGRSATGPSSVPGAEILSPTVSHGEIQSHSRKSVYCCALSPSYSSLFVKATRKLTATLFFGGPVRLSHAPGLLSGRRARQFQKRRPLIAGLPAVTSRAIVARIFRL
jgi:hypothetical protein